MTIAIITEAGARKVGPLVVVAQQAAAAATQMAGIATAVAQGRYYASYAAGNAATSAGQYFAVFTGGNYSFHVNGNATPVFVMPKVDGSGNVTLTGGPGVTAVLTVAPAASSLFGGLQVNNGGNIDMSLLAKGSTGETALSCGRSVGWGGHFKIIIDTVETARFTGSELRPGGDNNRTLGTGSFRWSTVYAATGAINTSDAREKTERRGFTLAELSAAKRIAATIGVFQFVGRIREHVGVVAQDVWAIMADEGLIDPIVEGETPSCAYAFLCYDEWDEIEGSPAGNRFGIRPDQLAYFLIAAQEARIAALESL